MNTTMDSFRRLLYRPPKGRPLLRNTGLIFPYPNVKEVESNASVVVLSPHPDDDVFGCGGSLLLHSKKGGRVATIYLTDGSRGAPDFGSPEEVAVERNREAREAAKVLGISRLFFLDQEDSRLSCERDVVGIVREHMEEQKPNIVYVPHFYDNHRDHFETNRVLLEVLRITGSQVRIRAFETWTPILPNCLVDVTHVFNAKLAAIRKHETQLAYIDYEEAVSGLNSYRAQMSGLRGFAEAFLETDEKSYRRMFSTVFRVRT
jgi:LmbE family N-acetylglucosaminyl deacetylase